MQGETASNGCSCDIELFDNAVNGIRFELANILHESYLGAIVERRIYTGGHPYHQHLYPYQLVNGFTDTDYFRIGDWHDTFMGAGLTRNKDPVTVRYQTTTVAGGGTCIALLFNVVQKQSS